MVTHVKNGHSVFQYELIKLLITTKLKKIDRSWQHFLFWSSFEPEAQMHDDDKEIGKNYRIQKRKVDEGGSEQPRKVFDVVNMSMSDISITEVERKLII